MTQKQVQTLLELLDRLIEEAHWDAKGPGPVYLVRRWIVDYANSKDWTLNTTAREQPVAPRKYRPTEVFEFECPTCHVQVTSETAKGACHGCKTQYEIRWPAIAKQWPFVV